MSVQDSSVDVQGSGAVGASTCRMFQCSVVCA